MAYINEIIETLNQPVISFKTTIAVADLPRIVGPVYNEIVNYIIS